MKYIIWNEKDNPLTAEVSESDRNYFKTYILPNLKPINETDYIEGFSSILHTAAKWSYILYKNKTYWLIEWNPGLIILELHDKDTINATALRSPIPNFGGRTPLDIDNDENYDEDTENHQYNLIFDAWDSQFDKQYQEWNHFKPAHLEELKLFQDSLKYVNKLGDITQNKFQMDFKNYFEKAKLNIEKWSKKGIITK